MIDVKKLSNFYIGKVKYILTETYKGKKELKEIIKSILRSEKDSEKEFQDIISKT